MSIGENIKKLRKEKGLTQIDLAKKIGVSQSMIYQVERGTKTLSLPLGKEIADTLGCTLDDLLNGKK